MSVVRINETQPLSGAITDLPDNIYGNYNSPLYQLIQGGLRNQPTTDPNPILFLQKYSSANRNQNSSEWEQGGLYSQLTKVTGNAYGAAITGNARVTGGSGDSIGIHARCSRVTPGGRGYALWGYFSGQVQSSEASHAAELNANVTYDPGYGSNHQLVRICMADRSADTNRFGSALTVGRNTKGGDNNGFHTGLRFEAGSIVRNTGNDGEAIRVDAPITSSGSIGGLRFARASTSHDGVFKYAFKTDEAVFADNEVGRLGVTQRLSWYSNGARRVSLVGGNTTLSITGGALNIANPVSDTGLQIAGTKVLGQRKGGWGGVSGTTSRAQFNTSNVTTSQLAERVKALIEDLTGHGLIGA